MEPDGVIHVMRGTYPITQQLALTKPGLTIRGSAGAEILLQAPVVPFLLGGGDETIDSLTMTSDQAYPVEFIQVAGSGNRILNCDIYGPQQPGDSSTWVVSRGLVTQPGATDILVQGCIFHSLRQPAYLSPGSSGTIMHNVCYNTRGYVVDGADFLFSGNSWGASRERGGHSAAGRDGLRCALRPALSPRGEQQQRDDKRPEMKRGRAWRPVPFHTIYQPLGPCRKSTPSRRSSWSFTSRPAA